jgi:hypothetical protein
VERLLAQGYLRQFFFKKDPSLDGEGGEVRQQKLALSEVLVILGGLSTNIGVTSNKRTTLRDQILITMDQESS